MELRVVAVHLNKHLLMVTSVCGVVVRGCVGERRAIWVGHSECVRRFCCVC